MNKFTKFAQKARQKLPDRAVVETGWRNTVTGVNKRPDDYQTVIDVTTPDAKIGFGR